MADKKCPRCNKGMVKCPKCDGKGRYRTVSYIPIISDVIHAIEGDDHMTKCPNCNGEGKLQCMLCGGNGVVKD